MALGWLLLPCLYPAAFYHHNHHGYCWCRRRCCYCPCYCFCYWYCYNYCTGFVFIMIAAVIATTTASKIIIVLPNLLGHGRRAQHGANPAPQAQQPMAYLELLASAVKVGPATIITCTSSACMKDALCGTRAYHGTVFTSGQFAKRLLPHSAPT